MDSQDSAVKSAKCATSAPIESNGDGDSQKTPDFVRLLAKQQETTRNHSFQLVRLQIKIEELQKEKAHEAEVKDGLKQQLKDCYDTIVDLKGHVAKLAVELYSGQSDTSRRHPQTFSQAPIRREFSYGQHRTWICGEEDTAVEKPKEIKDMNEVKDDKNAEDPTYFWSKIEDASSAAELVADHLLKEQRPALVESLKSLVKVQRSLTIADTDKPSSPVLEAFASLSLTDAAKGDEPHPQVASPYTNGHQIQNRGLL